MKALFYKYRVESLLVPLFMLYMWCLIPMEFLMEFDYLAASPLFFIFAGINYVIDSHKNESSNFNKYIMYLPVKRSTCVSFTFILVIISEILMYIISLLIGIYCPMFMGCEPISKSEPIILLVSMFMGMIIVGICLFVNFKYSSAKSAVLYYTLCLVSPISLGFVSGYTEKNGISVLDRIIDVLSNSPVTVIITLILEISIFVLEWVMSVKAYDRKDF